MAVSRNLLRYHVGFIVPLRSDAARIMIGLIIITSCKCAATKPTEVVNHLPYDWLLNDDQNIIIIQLKSDFTSVDIVAFAVAHGIPEVVHVQLLIPTTSKYPKVIDANG